MTLSASRQRRLGLVLGGGAGRGFAHIGVLQVLAEAGIWPQLVVGTSVGAFIGAGVAAGKSVAEITAFGERLRWRHLARPAWPRRGLLSFAPLERLLIRWLGDLWIEALPLPFACVATDALTGRPRVFTEGRLAPRVRASCSVPIVVQPCLIEDRWYVDGGMTDNLPIGVARRLGADVVLAVTLFGPADHLPAGLGAYSAVVLGHTLVRAGADPTLADVLVQPDLTDFDMVRMRRRELIARGRAAMTAQLPRLQAAMKGKG
jgi:NTE family protein